MAPPQISMSVYWGWTTVMTMPPALTLWEVSCVPVTMATREMESTAQVGLVKYYHDMKHI